MYDGLRTGAQTSVRTTLCEYIRSGRFFSLATRSPASSCVTVMASHSSCAKRRWSTSKMIWNSNNRQETSISYQNGTPSEARLSKKSFCRSVQAVSTSFSLDTTNRTYLYYTPVGTLVSASTRPYVIYINNACIIFCCSNKQYSITPVSIFVSVSTAVDSNFFLHVLYMIRIMTHT